MWKKEAKGLVQCPISIRHQSFSESLKRHCVCVFLGLKKLSQTFASRVALTTPGNQ